ncbi:MAG: hypothetical protein KDC87_17115, partial [Planctomycetes bacterium]|nr:hypothetical protein [Planctomycetota bacterium]
GAESQELMQTVVDDVRTKVDRLRDGAALDLGRVRRFGAAMLGCLAVTGTWAALDSGSLILWAKRNLFMSTEDWPRASLLSFAVDANGGVMRVPEGNDVMIEVAANGVVPEQVFIDYEYADGTTGREPMAMSGGEQSGARFTWLLESLISNVTLRAHGGDGLTAPLRIELVKRPMLEGLVITRNYPKYTQLEPDAVKASEGDIKIPAGTKLTFRGRSTKGLGKAFLTYGRDIKQAFTLDGAALQFEGSFEPKESGVLTLDVEDVDGLGTNKPPKLFVRVAPDRAPAVEFKTAGIGSMIVYKALIPGMLRIRDDFGITKVASKLRISGVAEDGTPPAGADKKEVPWEDVAFEDMRQPDTREAETQYEQRVVFDLLSRNNLQLGPLNPKNPIRPGMLLSIKFEAVDNFAPGEPHTGNSDVLTLRVVSEEKLMEDLHRRQAERRSELMRILEKEKGYKLELEEIISPTDSDPRAKQAAWRIQAIARDQRALQKQVQHLGDAYRQILDEYQNNRILNPSQIAGQRRAIQHPLEKLAKDTFLTSAQEVEDFARIGSKDLRSVAVATYGEIIQVLEEVISNMRHLESVAGVLEGVRKTRDAELRIEKEAQKLLEKEDTSARGKPKSTGGKPPEKK